MDALSLLTASVPSYFVIGPLVIILVVLVVLIGKKDTPKETIVVATPLSEGSTTAPVFIQPQMQASAAEGITPTTPPMPMITNSAVKESVPMHEPVIPQQPEPVVTLPTPPVAPVTMPPISSWKPLAPSPVAVGELIGESEGALQAQAIAQEVTPVVEVTKVQVVNEPVIVPEVASIKEAVVTEDVHLTASAIPQVESVTPPVMQAPVEVKA